MNASCCCAKLEGSSKVVIKFETGEAATPMSQPVGCETWTRAYFENIFPELNRIDRPRQDLGFERRLPPA
jgi:hypothetical protein